LPNKRLLLLKVVIVVIVVFVVFVVFVVCLYYYELDMLIKN